MSIDRMNLMDVALRLDPDKKTVAKIVERLHQFNPMVQDAPAYPSNAPMGNTVTRRSSLPSVAFGRVNEGYIRSKSSTEQFTDTMGMILAMSDCDRRLEQIHGAGNIAQIRWGEDKTFLEAIAQLIATTMLYGNELTNEAAFTGFQARLETLATSITGSQVIAGYDTPSGSDYTSIYVVDWGEEGAHVIYPMAGQAGVRQKDLGVQQVYDSLSNPFSAWVTEFLITLGIAVKDNRHIGRLCNVDVSQAQADTEATITYKMIDLFSAMPSPMGLSRVLYTHREIIAAWSKQTMRQQNVFFSWGEWNGEKTLMFQGYPVRDMDQMSKAESLVT